MSSRWRKDYWFQELDLVFTLIPKAGSSSVLNVLWALNDAVSSDTPTQEAYEVNLRKIGGKGDIHADANQRFLLKGAPQTSLPRLLVVRNPVDRLVSAWKDKVLLRQDPVIFRTFADQPWFTTVDDVSSMANLQDAFARFVAAMKWPTVADANGHWAPQHGFIASDETFDACLLTDDLQELPSILGRLNPALKFARGAQIPRRHETQQIDPSLFLTREVISRTEEIFAEDYARFAFVKEFKVSRVEKQLSTALGAPETESQLQAIRHRMLEMQLRWETQMLGD